MIRKVILMSALLIMFGSSYVQSADLEIGGYLRNTLSSQDLNENSPLNPELAIDEVINLVSLQLKLQADLDMNAKAYVRTSYDYDMIKGEDNFDLERAYLDTAFDELFPSGTTYLRLGKQRLAWGTGYAWNPTDNINPAKNPALPKEDDKGVNAIEITLPMGEATFKAVTLPQDKWDKTRHAFKIASFVSGFDLSGSVFFAGERTIWGADMAGVVFEDIGIHAEAALLSDKENSTLSYVLGADHLFSYDPIFQIIFEYYHNEAGYASMKDYLKAVSEDPTLSLSPGQIMRDYIYLGTSRSINDDIVFNGTILYNLNDGSYISLPGITYTPMVDTTFLLRISIFSGSDTSEFGSLPIDFATTLETTMYF